MVVKGKTEAAAWLQSLDYDDVRKSKRRQWVLKPWRLFHKREIKLMLAVAITTKAALKYSKMKTVLI